MDVASSSRGLIHARDHISIDIKHADEDLVNSIRNKMETISSSHCICRVKDNLRRTKVEAYVPVKVSIGPYHRHSKDALKAMEDQKWHYAHALLSRKPNLEAVLDDCVIALKEVEHRAKSCYNVQDMKNWKSHDFLQMMLVDGCFIIELFFRYCFKSLRRRNDPIFSAPGMLFELRCDLILLENQMPLFVIQRLFQVVPIPKECTYSLAEIAFHFFKNMIPGVPRAHRDKFDREGNHLLDLIGHCLLPTYPKLQPKQSKSEGHLSCATELIKSAGIRIKKAREENLLDIKFVNGVLEIPPIIVHQHTENLFRNLIALEQCSTDSNVQYITSYVVLMKSLLHCHRDVKLLQEREILILTNYGAKEEEEAPKLFEKLCEEVDVKESYYSGLCEQVNGYRGRTLRVWFKKWKQRYRENTMSRLVLILAIFILLLTLVGTSFSILSYALHHHW